MTARRPLVLAGGARQELKNGDTLLTPASASGAAGLRLPHGAAPSAPTDGDAWTTTAGLYVRINGVTVGPLGGAVTTEMGITIDGGGSVITTGLKGFLRVPVACTIVAATVLADQSGSIVIDVWKDTYANYPPTVGDTITASAKPTLSTAQKSEDTTLTGWTVSCAAGDVLGFNVDSVAMVQRVHLFLKITI